MHVFLFVSFSLRQDCGQVGIERQAHCRRGFTWAFEWHQKISLGMDNSLFFFFFFFLLLLLLLLLLCVLLLLCWRKKIMPPPAPPTKFLSTKFLITHAIIIIIIIIIISLGRVGFFSEGQRGLGVVLDCFFQ
jgi:hypothetical protein